LKSHPQHQQALQYLADTMLSLGHPEQAEALLRKALRLDPKLRLAHLDLGIILAGRNNVESASAHFREAIRLDPSKADAHYRLARLLHSQGRTAEAEREFAKVKELQSEVREDLLTQVSGSRR